MLRLSKSLSLLFLVFVFTSAVAGAKTVKLVHSGSAYYASFYLSSSAGSESFEGKGEGWSHSVNLPENATNIVIKVRTNKFLDAYSDACQSSAGSKGGTFTLTGLLHSESCAFVPNGSTSSESSISIDRNTMDVLKPNGNSQLFEAVSLKVKATITELISAGTSHIDAKNRQGLTPLHKAVQLGDQATQQSLPSSLFQPTAPTFAVSPSTSQSEAQNQSHLTNISRSDVGSQKELNWGVRCPKSHHHLHHASMG